MTSLQEAKDFINQNVEKGVCCPCCKQYLKLYKRKMYSGPTVLLVALYRLSNRRGNNFYHVIEILKQVLKNDAIKIIGDGAKANYFGLMEEKKKEKNKTHKRTSGFWKITEKGRLFVEGKIKIPKYAFVLDGKITGYSKEEVDVFETIGKKFDYAELMGFKTATSQQQEPFQKSLF